MANVAQHSKIIVAKLNESGLLPFEVVWKPTLITNEVIRKTFNEANNEEECAGIIVWYHTFSPAKSWILGLRELRKPLLHLHTQFNKEIEGEYEKNTGLVIVETFETRGLNPMHTPAILCSNHGPFTWGKDAAEAVHNAVVLEEIARMARNTEVLNPKVQPAPDAIKDKHFYRKHGANAYYGQ